MVGVGQSMYEVERYTAVNELGTAALMQALLERPVGRLVASSMSVYGEGRYLTAAGEVCDYAERDAVRIRAGDWDPTDRAGGPLRAIATPEEKRPSLRSVYALNKYAQERMSLLIGDAYGIPTIALRFFNVYGTARRCRTRTPGSLPSLAPAFLTATARGCSRTAPSAATSSTSATSPVPAGWRWRRPMRCRACSTSAAARAGPYVTSRSSWHGHGPARAEAGNHRTLPHRRRPALLRGHQPARQVLGFEPQVAFEEGLEELVAWLADATAIDRVDEATEELTRRGLVA